MAITATDWAKRVEITENIVAPSLTGFVALLTEANLPAEIFTLPEVVDGGGDLRVCLNSDGTGQLPLEVVEFTKGTATAALWIRIPSFAEGTSFWLFYGKAAEVQPPVTDPNGRNAVWVDYKAVVNDLVTDSTGNGFSPIADQSALAVGKTGAGRSYQIGLNDFTEFSTTILANPTFTLDIWEFCTVSGGYILTDSGNVTNLLLQRNNDTQVSAFVDGVQLAGRISSNFNQWNKYTLTSDGASYSAYLNGNLDTGSIASTFTALVGSLYLGNRGTLDRDFEGILSGLNISYSEKSPNYILTEYTNQNTPATFWSTGTPESTVGGGATFSLVFDAGAYVYTGNTFDLTASRNVSLEAGTYTYTGQDLGLSAGRNITLDAGGYVYNGQDLNLKTDRNVSFDAGSYAVIGQDLTLLYTPDGGPTYLISLDAGSYQVTGNDITLAANRAILLDAGGYSYTGQTVVLAANRKLGLDAGAYAVTGEDSTLIASRNISLETGVYSYTGIPITLDYSGEIISLISEFSVNYANDDVVADYSANTIEAAYSNQFITARFL